MNIAIVRKNTASFTRHEIAEAYCDSRKHLHVILRDKASSRYLVMPPQFAKYMIERYRFQLC